MTDTDQPDGHVPLDHGRELWADPRWRFEAVEWLDKNLEAHGIERTGPVEQPHLRPWATALRAPTSHGAFWLKVAGPSTAMEISLYGVLDAHVHGRVLTPLVIDRQRSWIVLPDGGPTLGDTLPAPDLVDAMCVVLPYYAQLQLDLMSSVDEMLALGVADMRPQMLPSRLREALDLVRPYVVASGNPDNAETFDRLVSATASYDQICAELAAGPVPVSLQHDDLHPWNVFAAHYACEPVFFDWGDSVIAHPFASMLVTLRVVKNLAGVSDDSVEVRRVRDAYLEPFTQLAPRQELVTQLELACHTGKVVRSLSWARILGGFSAVDEDADAPFSWLALLLDGSFLGRVGDDD